MEPVNTKERTTAIIKFAGLLLLTIVVILVAVFADVKLPTKRLAVLQRENAQLKASLGNEVNVLVRLDSINDQFIRLDSDLTPITSQTITAELIDLNKVSAGDSSVKGKTLKQVVTAYKLLLDTKTNLRKLGSSAAEIARLEKELEERKKELDEAKDDLKECERDLVLYKR